MQVAECVACNTGNLSSEDQKCTICHRNVHLIPSCSVTAGDEEGYGDKRACKGCYDDKRKCATLPLQATENWRGQGIGTKKTSRGRYLGRRNLP